MKNRWIIILLDLLKVRLLCFKITAKIWIGGKTHLDLIVQSIKVVKPLVKYINSRTIRLKVVQTCGVIQNYTRAYYITCEFNVPSLC